MRPFTKKLVIAAIVYVGLWAGTWLYAPVALQHQIYKEAIPAWSESRRQREVVRKDIPQMRELPVYERGPVARVELLLCPAPFVIKTDCGRSIGGLNGHGWIGWYLFTPWRVYELPGTSTWES